MLFYRYGELQGYNKQETAERCGKEQVYKWRRSYDAQPPNGESLEMCLRRAVTYFKEQVKAAVIYKKHKRIKRRLVSTDAGLEIMTSHN